MNSDKVPSNEVSILLTRLNEISSAVMRAAEAHSVELVLERIAAMTREMVRADYAALGIPDGRGGLRFFKVAGITPEEISRMDHFPHGKGLLGAVMEERETLRVEHIHEDPRSVGFPKYHPMMDRFLGAPIQAGEQLFGMLYLCDPQDGQPFTEQDQWLVETIAGYAALAIAGSQLHEQQERLILLEERERISMELHDGIIQSLYAVGMHLELIRTASNPASKQPVEEGLRNVIQDLNVTIDDIRTYIMNLKRSSNVVQKSIRDSLADVILKLYVPPNVRIEVDAPDSPPLFSPQEFESICQIVNEAISNAIRHAEATRIMISALQNERTLLISIKDNGKGFDPGKLNQHSGLGLRNMQQRAQLHDGQLSIESAVGQGTWLSLSIPVTVV